MINHNHKRPFNNEASDNDNKWLTASPPLEKIAKNESKKETILEGIASSPIAAAASTTGTITAQKNHILPSFTTNAAAVQSLPKIRTDGVPTLQNGLYLTKVACLGAEANRRALSLFELIRQIRPIASIHFNFCIDPAWVINQYSRSLRQCPITFIVGQRHLPDLQAASAQFPNVQCAAVPLPFAYGTHHTKLSLYESETALHVVVSTANLIEEDWALKTQAFYHWRAPFGQTENGQNIKEGQNRPEQQSSQNFRDDLIEYLQCAYGKNAGKAHHLVSYWLERILNGPANFGQCPDRLIASIPGRYYKSKGDLNKFGHIKLRIVLAQKFSADELKQKKTFVGQFSSIGSLGPMPQSWLCDEFVSSLCGANQMLLSSSLKLIYPSVQNVRQSLEGYAAGLSLPYTSGVHNRQPYLRQFLHQWKSERHSRTQAMPHVKTYAGFVMSDDAKSPQQQTQQQCQQQQLQWLLVTSANLSCSAWGKLEKCREQLFIRSYELGVLLCAKEHGEEQLLLPYDWPLTKYSADDQLFCVDQRYPLPTPPDAYGFHGAGDVRMAAA